MRQFVAILFLILPALLGMLIVGKFLGPFLPVVVIILLAILAGTLMSYYWTLEMVSFVCPENTAYLGVNTLTKGLFTVTQGFSLKYPWDEIDERNKFLLDLRNVICTKEGETTERAIVNVKARISYEPDPSSVELLKAYNSLGNPAEADTKVREAVESILGRVVLEIMPTKTLDNFRNAGAEIQTRLESELKINIPGSSIFETRFGIKIGDLVVEDMTVPKDSPTAKVNSLVAKLAIYQTKAGEMAAALRISIPKAFDIILLADPDSQALRIMGQGIGIVQTNPGGNP